VLARRLDVTDPASIERVAADLTGRYGRLDPLVNNAAIHQGRIVNVSSEAGSLASMNGVTPAYNVSKAALNALTRMLPSDLRRDRDGCARAEAAVRTVPTQRSATALALALGARIGVQMISAPVERQTSSNALVNLVSGSRIRNLNAAARSPSATRRLQACCATTGQSSGP
jgi:enoyl-[acyl-carrier-protein] reductase (NADH)